MIRILNSTTLEIVETITKYTSIIFNLNFYEVGDFTLTLPLNILSENIKLNNYILWKDNVGIIKYINITDTTITVKGCDIKGLLSQRICKGTWNGAVETVVKNIVSENTQENRAFPLFSVSETKGIGEEVDAISKGGTVADTISEICENNDFGWDIKLKNKELIFDVIKPKNANCVYGVRYKNVSGTEYTLSILNETNTTFNSFQNEGLEVTVEDGRFWVNKGKCRLSDGSVFVLEEKTDSQESIPSGSNTTSLLVTIGRSGEFVFEKWRTDQLSTFQNPYYVLCNSYKDDVFMLPREEELYFTNGENTGLERSETYSDNFEKPVEYEKKNENATATIISFSDYKTKWELGDVVKLRLDYLGQRVTFETPITEVQLVCEAGNQRVIPTFGENKKILKKLIKELKNNAR